MNERTIHAAWVQTTVFFVGAALLISCGTAYAEGAREGNAKALLLPPSQEDQSVLKRRLLSAKRDIEAFRVFAENFRDNGNMKTLAQLQNPVDDFLKKHVDNLLTQSIQHANLETTRLTAEIMFIKARLFICLNRDDAAQQTVADMKKRFGSYQKISVELPGKTTTLDEGIRLLDEELAKAGAAGKK
ncbi:MAG TPA: hypothetical protein VEM32_06295 [Geobacteraceae bacterium]|nr:hypothetical protein [Geobacteraceae bacterium]